MTPLELANKLREQFKGLFSDPADFRGEITLVLLDPNRLVEVCRFAKESLEFDFMLDITSIDNYGEDPRWTLVYELYGLKHRCHLRLKFQVAEETSAAPSITGVWRTANWHEREIFDMMGIRFTGHPDLRRILMWDGYPYYPLRKDFPLAGKASEMPDVAFSRKAPLEGGPFVTSVGKKNAEEREPRGRSVDD